MKTGVDIYGGFSGHESAKAQRTLGLNTVYLSGDIDQNDTGSGAGYNRVGNNSYTVVKAANAVLDGVTILGASNTGGNGGGMIISGASPSLNQVTFLKNTAISGGGIANIGGADPILNNVSFISNSATAGLGGGGGAIYNEASITLNKAFLSGNSATFKGGAINNRPDTAAEMQDIIFINNVGEDGTASDIYSFSGSNLILSNAISWNSSNQISLYSESTSTMTLANITTNKRIYCIYAPDCSVQNILAFNATVSNVISGTNGNQQISAVIGSTDDPFVNANSPLGADGKPFTSDDGYALKAGAAVIDQGVAGAPTLDILGLGRVGVAPDPGAYEYR